MKKIIRATAVLAAALCLVSCGDYGDGTERGSETSESETTNESVYFPS